MEEDAAAAEAGTQNAGSDVRRTPYPVSEVEAGSRELVEGILFVVTAVCMLAYLLAGLSLATLNMSSAHIPYAFFYLLFC